VSESFGGGEEGGEEGGEGVEEGGLGLVAGFHSLVRFGRRVGEREWWAYKENLLFPFEGS